MILEVVNVSKRFGKRNALDSINFSIEHGEIVGLIGPNGSGKTTLLNILMGTMKPTSGSFTIKKGAKIGMSVSRKGFFDDMTVLKNLMLHSQLLEVKLNDVLAMMEHFLIHFGQIRFGKLSAGMKQKVSLVLPFISKNDLIYLDEPSNHLDIDSILILRSLILKTRIAGTAFLITSHILADLEKVCDRIIFLKDGALSKDSSTVQLMQTYGNLENAYLDIVSGDQA